MSERLRLKITFEDQIRRFSLPAPCSFQQLVAFLASYFPLGEKWGLRYDDGDDWVNIVVASDWEEALLVVGSLLRVEILLDPHPEAVIDTSFLKKVPEHKKKTNMDNDDQPQQKNESSSSEKEAPLTLSQICDQMAGAVRQSASLQHSNVKSECDIAILEALEKCNSLYEKEREECEKESPIESESGSPIEEFVEFDVVEFAERLDRLSLEVKEQCSSVSEEAVNSAMRV